MDNNFTEGECRTYENLDALRLQVDNTDSASLHFESILENDTEPDDVECTAKGFSFGAQRGISSHQGPVQRPPPDANYQNDAMLNRADFSHKFSAFGAMPKNELIDNALFNKFREAADTAATTSDGRESTSHSLALNKPNDLLCDAKLTDSSSGNCDDLLEFADKEAAAKDRGTDSDEVRIMTKILGAAVSTYLLNNLSD